MLNIISKDKRFKGLFYEKNKKVLNDMINKLNLISKSEELKKDCMCYIYRQNDMLRYVELVKAYASTPRSKDKNTSSIIDKNLEIENPESVIVNDTLKFYQKLDEMTGYKHQLSTKVGFKLKEVTFIKDNTYSCVGRNGQKWFIKVSVDPYVFNRIAMPHEMWHAINEQYMFHKGKTLDADIIKPDYPNDLRKEHMIGEVVAKGGKASEVIEPDIDEYYDDQFVEEIGTMFIQKLATDYLLETYSADKELCQNLRRLNNIYKNDYIKGAQDAYLDHLIVMAMAGSKKSIKAYANREIVNQCGKLWTVKKLIRKINQLYRVAEGKEHFYPMNQFRYAVGNAIAEAIYEKYQKTRLIEDEEKSKKAVARILDKVVKLNENEYNIYKLKSKKSTAKNKIDIITEFFGLDNIERLLSKQSNEIGTLNVISNNLRDYSLIDTI